jgi:hypothetical protein
MRLQVMKVAGVGIALVALLGACSSSSKKSSTQPTTPPTTAPPATTTTTSPPSPYKATASPTTNLTSGTTVTVHVTGFTPGKQLGINECSTTTDNNGSGCDLGNIQIIHVGPDGAASGSIKVKNGPFGTAKIVCTQLKAPDYCLLSVGELISSANAERSNDVRLFFTG